jgi:hypothetical protein
MVLGESLMLSVQVGKLNILAAYDVPAPLLHAYEVVSVVLCEAPDYVKWAYNGALLRSVYAVPPLALLNIVVDSFPADSRSAGGVYAAVTEEGPITRRVCGRL